MPITTKHPEFESHVADIEKTQSAVNGNVREYVPRRESQTAAQYKKFIDRPSYYNVTERTAMAVVGALTRKPAMLEGLDELRVSGMESLEQFIQTSYMELLTGGRCGWLVDIDDDGIPYVTSYHSTAIVNWCSEFIVLREWYYAPDEKDRYTIKQKCRYRELYLDDDGLYAVRVWCEKAKNRWEVEEEIVPLVRGQRLDYIPFVSANPYDVSLSPVKPPLYTVACINIEHFILQACMSHVTWVLSFPVPTISGDLQDSTQSKIGFGGDHFLHLTQGSTATFLEFSGSGAKVIQEQIKEKEMQMFTLGGRMLQFKNGVESSDALQMRLGSENTSMFIVAQTLQEALNRVAAIYSSMLLTAEDDVEIRLNMDFTPAVLSPQEMAGLLQMYQAGVITLDTLLHRLYEGEIVTDVDEEKEGLTGMEDDPEGTDPESST